jgi:hypothetical protein
LQGAWKRPEEDGVTLHIGGKDPTCFLDWTFVTPSSTQISFRVNTSDFSIQFRVKIGNILRDSADYSRSC